jgi:transcriptional regulator with XRE-family HTH domain
MKNNLKHIRVSKGLTQQEVADAVSEKLATYRTWERGTTNFNIVQLVECARVLDCSTDEILGLEIQTEFTDPREAELHRVWRGLDRERQDRLLATAYDMETAKSGGCLYIHAEEVAE